MPLSQRSLRRAHKNHIDNLINIDELIIKQNFPLPDKNVIANLIANMPLVFLLGKKGIDFLVETYTLNKNFPINIVANLTADTILNALKNYFSDKDTTCYLISALAYLQQKGHPWSAIQWVNYLLTKKNLTDFEKVLAESLVSSLIQKNSPAIGPLLDKLAEKIPVNKRNAALKQTHEKFHAIGRDTLNSLQIAGTAAVIGAGFWFAILASLIFLLPLIIATAGAVALPAIIGCAIAAIAIGGLGGVFTAVLATAGSFLARKFIKAITPHSLARRLTERLGFSLSLASLSLPTNVNTAQQSLFPNINPFAPLWRVFRAPFANINENNFWRLGASNAITKPFSRLGSDLKLMVRPYKGNFVSYGIKLLSQPFRGIGNVLVGGVKVFPGSIVMLGAGLLQAVITPKISFFTLLGETIKQTSGMILGGIGQLGYGATQVASIPLTAASFLVVRPVVTAGKALIDVMTDEPQPININNNNLNDDPLDDKSDSDNHNEHDNGINNSVQVANESTLNQNAIVEQPAVNEVNNYSSDSSSESSDESDYEEGDESDNHNEHDNSINNSAQVANKSNLNQAEAVGKVRQINNQTNVTRIQELLLEQSSYQATTNNQTNQHQPYGEGVSKGQIKTLSLGMQKFAAKCIETRVADQAPVNYPEDEEYRCNITYEIPKIPVRIKNEDNKDGSKTHLFDLAVLFELKSLVHPCTNESFTLQEIIPAVDIYNIMINDEALHLNSDDYKEVEQKQIAPPAAISFFQPIPVPVSAPVPYHNLTNEQLNAFSPALELFIAQCNEIRLAEAANARLGRKMAKIPVRIRDDQDQTVYNLEDLLELNINPVHFGELDFNDILPAEDIYNEVMVHQDLFIIKQ